MKFEKISSYPDYKEWLKKEYKYGCTNKDINNYESITEKMKRTLENTPIWNDFKNNMVDYNSEYYIKTGGYNLFYLDKEEIDIKIKPFPSLIHKSYRKNILLNNQFPKIPKSGLITPDNWYEKINDLLRTTIVVKYLDGVKFFLEKTNNYFSSNKIVHKSQLEAKEKGDRILKVWFCKAYH